MPSSHVPTGPTDDSTTSIDRPSANKYPWNPERLRELTSILITGKQLVVYMIHNPEAQHLDLVDSDRLLARFLRDCSENGPLHHLEALEIERPGSRISAVFLKQSLPRLRILRVINSKLASPPSILSVRGSGNEQRVLERLELRSCGIICGDYQDMLDALRLLPKLKILILDDVKFGDPHVPPQRPPSPIALDYLEMVDFAFVDDSVGPMWIIGGLRIPPSARVCVSLPLNMELQPPFVGLSKAIFRNRQADGGDCRRYNHLSIAEYPTHNGAPSMSPGCTLTFNPPDCDQTVLPMLRCSGPVEYNFTWYAASGPSVTQLLPLVAPNLHQLESIHVSHSLVRWLALSSLASDISTCYLETSGAVYGFLRATATRQPIFPRLEAVYVDHVDFLDADLYSPGDARPGKLICALIAHLNNRSATNGGVSIVLGVGKNNVFEPASYDALLKHSRNQHATRKTRSSDSDIGFPSNEYHCFIH